MKNKILLLVLVCILALVAAPSRALANPPAPHRPAPRPQNYRPPVVVVVRQYYVPYVAPSAPLNLLPLAITSAPCPAPRYFTPYGRR